MPTATAHSWVVCIENTGYPAAVELRKVYQRIPDPKAEADGFARVVDESGEDYLFPTRFFAAIEVPSALERTFAQGGE
ncbi:MAG: hypothetical protein KBF21_14010 [Thermoanaerobaculia bacterium]|nr:hypothetical protein [Thermoanaerobaculia bacterium]MBP9825334.1 hypothetical protein [Thermoanaerobaculia bacterium]